MVRTPLKARRRPRRSFDQRLALRFPGLAAATGRLIARRAPDSRLRRALLARTVQLGLEAYNRRDPEAVAIGCDPEFEYRPGQEWVEAGLVEPCYRGLEGYRRYLASVDEVWAENLLTPVELIDVGEQLVLLAEGSMRAQGSGVPLDQVFALVATLKEGRVIRLQEYYDYAAALAAVGLAE